jgi:hypothetical protein
MKGWIFEAGYGSGIEGSDAEEASPARHLGRMSYSL